MRKAILHALASGVAPDPVPAGDRDAREDARRRERCSSRSTARRACPRATRRRRGFVERLAWAEAFTRVWERIASEQRQGTSGAPVLPRRADLVRALEQRARLHVHEGPAAPRSRSSRRISREPRPMRRLLLGDVGTGKTAVALAAAAQCVAGGLPGRDPRADQRARRAVRRRREAARARARAARVAFVAAGLPAAARRKRRGGDPHAAPRRSRSARTRSSARASRSRSSGSWSSTSSSASASRSASRSCAKGERPHLLTLSATPIPRTLALALRGELATSTLSERPAGRPPVATALAGASKRRRR